MRLVSVLFLAFSFGACAEPGVWYGDRPDPANFSHPSSQLSPLLRSGTRTFYRTYGRIDIDRILNAHLEAAAQLTLYRDYRKVFLGRTVEYVYDMYRLLSTPQERERTHLANVSRRISGDNGTDPLLRQYLAQQGITEARLQAGEKFLIVDMIGSGALYNRIVALFPGHEEQFRSHFVGTAMGAGNEESPSSRVFQLSLRPDERAARGSMNYLLRAYDNLPRFSTWGTELRRRPGSTQIDVWSDPRERFPGGPEGALGRKENHNYDPEMARRFMEHQAWWASRPATIELWQHRVLLYRELREMADRLMPLAEARYAARGTPRAQETLRAHNTEITRTFRALEAILARPENRHDPMVHGAIYDFLDIFEKNYGSIAYLPERLTVAGEPLPRVIDPARIRVGAPVGDPVLARALRLAQGQLPLPELLDEPTIRRIRLSGLRSLGAHLESPEARRVLRAGLTDPDADIVVAAVATIRDRQLPPGVRAELLESLAMALADPINLDNRVIRQALIETLQTHEVFANPDIVDRLELALEDIATNPAMRNRGVADGALAVLRAAASNGCLRALVRAAD